MKTLLLTLCLLTVSGCSQKIYTGTVFDSNGNVLKEPTVKLNSFGTEHEAKVIFVYTKDNEKILFVGDYKQLLNPEVIGAVFKGITAAFLDKFVPVGGAVVAEGIVP